MQLPLVATPPYTPLRFFVASVVAFVPGILVYRRVLKVEALSASRRLVAAVAIGVVTALAGTIAYLLSGATAGFQGADEHPAGVAAFFGVCLGICAVLFRDGLRLSMRKRSDPP